MRSCAPNPQVEQLPFPLEGRMRPKEPMKSRNVDVIARCTSSLCEAAAIEAKPTKAAAGDR
jgi:hypothetical protein